jgi:hypothetical protein
MGSKALEPWSPRWVRQQLREMRNGLPPNDPNNDEGCVKQQVVGCTILYSIISLSCCSLFLRHVRFNSGTVKVNN